MELHLCSRSGFKGKTNRHKQRKVRESAGNDAPRVRSITSRGERPHPTNHHLCTIAQSSCVVVLVEIVEMESSTPLPLPDTQRSPIWQHTAALRAMFQLDGFLLLP